MLKSHVHPDARQKCRESEQRNGDDPVAENTVGKPPPERGLVADVLRRDQPEPEHVLGGRAGADVTAIGSTIGSTPGCGARAVALAVGRSMTRAKTRRGSGSITEQWPDGAQFTCDYGRLGSSGAGGPSGRVSRNQPKTPHGAGPVAQYQSHAPGRARAPAASHGPGRARTPACRWRLAQAETQPGDGLHRTGLGAEKHESRAERCDIL
jgi:hypothetical protein